MKSRIPLIIKSGIAGGLACSYCLTGVAVAEDSRDVVTQTPALNENIGMPENAVIVTVDKASVFRISEPAKTVIIGNPAIADVTIEDEKTLLLTGRSFGVTNIIILGEKGKPIIDRPVVVRNHEINTVRIYRRSSRETYACAPVCEPTLTIGDSKRSFGTSNQQIRARNELNEQNADRHNSE